MGSASRLSLVVAVAVVVSACGDAGGDDESSTLGTTLSTSTTAGSDTSGSDGPSTTMSGTTMSVTTMSMTTSDADSGSMDTGSSEGGTTGAVGLGCDNESLLVCEDFEGAALGGFPEGWDRRATGTWLGGGMGVADDAAYRGTQALRLDGAENGAQWLAYQGDLGGLAMQHYGRMFVRVQTPAPWPSDGVLHGDFFEARGPFGNDNTNSVRWGIVENTQQFFQWIYNVQRSTDEFGTGTAYTYQWSDAWFCMEWHHDQTTQAATLWLDGVEVAELTQDASMNPEIPIYDDISVGWANYQLANPQFVVWIDEVALDDERIGCDGL